MSNQEAEGSWEGGRMKWSKATVQSERYGQHIVRVPYGESERLYLHAPAKNAPPDVFTWDRRRRRWLRITWWGESASKAIAAIKRFKEEE